jgi:hypothetical protein
MHSQRKVGLKAAEAAKSDIAAFFICELCHAVLAE